MYFANIFSILAGMKYYDYLFLLPPSEKVKLSIKSYKLMAGGIIGNYETIYKTAHVTIKEMSAQNRDIIDLFVQRIRHKTENMPAMQLHINNFGNFAHSEELYTVYAAIKPTYKTDEWLSSLRRLFEVNSSIFPHITIAKTISLDNFMALWPLFSNEVYQESFLCDRLVILERETNAPNSRWYNYQELTFKNTIKY